MVSVGQQKALRSQEDTPNMNDLLIFTGLQS